MSRVPEIGDFVLYYTERNGEQIRTPREAIVMGVNKYRIGNSALNSNQHSLDLIVMLSDDCNWRTTNALNVGGDDNQYGAVDYAYWAWPN